MTSNADLIDQCEFKGDVKGGNHMMGGVLSGSAEKSAFKRLKKHAWKMGANTVLVTMGNEGWSGATYRGEAYDCPREIVDKIEANGPTPTQPPQPTPSPPPR